jgi:hypothetical protein
MCYVHVKNIWKWSIKNYTILGILHNMSFLLISLYCVILLCSYFNMKFGKTYERKSRLKILHFLFNIFRFKGVIRHFMHHFCFHTKHLNDYFKPKTRSFCNWKTRILSKCYSENGDALVDIKLKTSLI